jgi:hypothetical protein
MWARCRSAVARLRGGTARGKGDALRVLDTPIRMGYKALWIPHMVDRP